MHFSLLFFLSLTSLHTTTTAATIQGRSTANQRRQTDPKPIRGLNKGLDEYEIKATTTQIIGDPDIALSLTILDGQVGDAPVCSILINTEVPFIVEKQPCNVNNTFVSYRWNGKDDGSRFEYIYHRPTNPDPDFRGLNFLEPCTNGANCVWRFRDGPESEGTEDTGDAEVLESDALGTTLHLE
ncbi:hypothetical protein HYALB_00011210 [Hymenoscyphus albidus]|uniref:AA1-like domain-containing protein n=1 Tax=Hymenoscyphus albidus TaxID=595503 RepID=A0A9N9LID0_9HELO|nr:hypothetical protein HYALB_00011210 [Hymenoscyphus albidus]